MMNMGASESSTSTTSITVTQFPSNFVSYASCNLTNNNVTSLPLIEISSTGFPTMIGSCQPQPVLATPNFPHLPVDPTSFISPSFVSFNNPSTNVVIPNSILLPVVSDPLIQQQHQVSCPSIDKSVIVTNSISDHMNDSSIVSMSNSTSTIPISKLCCKCGGDQSGIAEEDFLHCRDCRLYGKYYLIFFFCFS